MSSLGLNLDNTLPTPRLGSPSPPMAACATYPVLTSIVEVLKGAPFFLDF
jgi:hypothetical protein